MKRNEKFVNQYATKKVDTKAIKQLVKDPENFEYYKYILTEEFVREYADVVDWYQVAYYSNNLTEDFVIEHKKHFKKDVMWALQQNYGQFSDKFVKTFAKKLDWTRLNYGTLTEKFIEENLDKVDWEQLARTATVSKSFMNRYSKNFKYGTYMLYHRETLSKADTLELWNKCWYEHDRFAAYFRHCGIKEIEKDCKYFCGE